MKKGLYFGDSNLQNQFQIKKINVLLYLINTTVLITVIVNFYHANTEFYCCIAAILRGEMKKIRASKKLFKRMKPLSFFRQKIVLF